MRHLLVTTCAALGLAALAPARDALAYGPGDALVACVSQDTTVRSTILDHVAKSCGVTRGNKSACAVISGDPWICNKKVGPNPTDDRSCLSGDGTITFTIGVSTALPTGWKVEGTAEATLVHTADLINSKQCSADPINPATANGDAGGFTDLSATLEYYVKITVKGKITVSGPGGTFILDAGVGCTARASTPVYRTQDTTDCKLPKTCTKTTAPGFADTGCDPDAGVDPAPDASPPPDPTPDASQPALDATTDVTPTTEVAP